MMEWVTIVKISKELSEELRCYYNQFVGRTYPVIGEEWHKVILPIKPYFALGGETDTVWKRNEVRPATEEEIHQGELEMGAEKI